ncbi:acetate CoA-transferase subunit alpha [Neobacillus drentensis]|uniref:acetate CoA-transferase subunit alpha n=1 Tax=Neobacillus drentensis TaxID=220684 RepID=UPI0028653E9B|nr:acetate CoA-transferase subunit alpha [Neobacillus drentensis]MDR7237595.1 acetate CoA/acetoacetate CoA-transferase alpha subunit [Neobacillus drentensis]
MSKTISREEISSMFKDGMTVMVGGFMGVGTPEEIVSIILENGIKDLTLISDDTAFIDTGVGPLIVNHRVKKAITTHIGKNPEAGRQMIAGELEVELVPMGTFVERVRAGGAGLGGILTPTGVGTVVEEGKEKLTVDGRVYLLEKPLHAEVALLKAYKADKNGNLIYRKAARNFNPLMALAADLVIVQVEQLVEIGEIDSNDVMTPGILVDKIFVQGGCE